MEWDSYNNLLHQLQVGAQKDILKSLQLPKKKKKLTTGSKHSHVCTRCIGLTFNIYTSV